jgi:hypothetical protein
MPARRIRAAFAIALGAILAACSPAPTDRPPPVTASPPGSSIASPGGSVAPPATPPCVGDELALDLGPWEGAAGSRFVALTARTQEDVSCTLAGSPGVALQDAAGEIILDSLSEPDGLPRVEPGDPVIVIGVDRGATLAIGTSNWCLPPPRVPLGILLTLPDDSVVGHIPAEGSVNDLPPCTAPGEPGRIFVQVPWQPEA